MVNLSVLILSYNTKDLLRQCLDSVLKFLPKSNTEVIVVDNASTDGSREMVKKEFPHIQLISSPENLGFTKGMNLAAKHAHGRYLLLLNSDAELTDVSIEEMVKFIDANEKIGVVGGTLRNSDGTRQRSYGTFYTLPTAISMLIAGDKAEIDRHELDTPKAVDWVSGGFMVVRRALFEKLHGFDEHLFMYMEDMEFCYRIKKAGEMIFTFPEASAIHKGQGSSNRAFAIKQIYKGLLYFYKKHRSPFEYAVIKFVLTVKAKILILLGGLTHNTYLQTTYRQALRP